MPLFAFGINHRTAPLQVRERVAFAPEQLSTAHRSLCDCPGINEAVIVSTCNRSEIYCSADEAELKNIKDQLACWLSTYHGLSSDALEEVAYIKDGSEAVEHLARVACGLDSLILGEPQILGQLKSAYAVASGSQAVGQFMNRLFQHSFAVAKEVRTQTAIGQNPVSVAYAAVSLSTHIFSRLENCTALLIGAGETIDLVARHLREKGIRRLIIANRTLARAEQLAEEFGADAVMLGDIPEVLHQADIVISSTASQLPILGKGSVEAALKKRRHAPVFMVDIAVPRDIEEQVADLDDVYLYTVDDLEQVIRDNVKSREEAADEAVSIIHDSTQKFVESIRVLDAVATITAFRRKLEQQKDAEQEKALRRLSAGEDPEKVLSAFASSLTNKFAHLPTTFLRQAASEGRQDRIDLVAELFELDKN